MINYLKSTDARVVVFDSEKACTQCGSYKVLNIALLGAAVKRAGHLGYRLRQ